MSASDPWRPLAGMRLLDLTTMLPGPFASQVFADLGADVIKVERPPHGDPMRVLQPHMFEAVNAGKRSVLVDLRKGDDLAFLLELASAADVVMEGFRPGVVERLGFGFEDVRRRNPAILYLSLSGWGRQGPLARDPGHNGTFMARTGATFLTGDPGCPPSDAFPAPLSDLAASLYGVIVVLAALRGDKGPARHLDVSLFDSALAVLAPRLAEYVGTGATTRDDIMLRPANGTFPCRDGHVLVAAVEDHFFKAMCDALNLADLGDDPGLASYQQRRGQAAEINVAITARTSSMSRDDAVARLRSAGVPASPVLAPEEVVDDEQVRANGLVDRAGPWRTFIPLHDVKSSRPMERVVLDASGDAVRQRGW